MSTRRPLIALVAAALVVMTAAGCGTGASNSTSGSAGTVKKGGILNIGTTSGIDSLNPFIAIESQAYNAFVMEYPQLVQYGPGIKLEGDWATSWKVSNGGKTYTFHLKPGGKWSDGVPLTAEDAAWTGNTIIKYKDGASAVLAAALTHVKDMQAPNPTTLVVNYDQPVGNALPQLEQFWVLPKHVWDKQVGNNGKDLKTYRPEQHLPTVAAGPYTITSYAEKGTTVFKPNPYFYGPKSNAAAVALTYYTNSTSMIADLQAGTVDFVDQVPFDAASSVKNSGTFNVDEGAGAEVTNITFNSNPAKPKNRELLDPKVKEALEYATNRQQIAKTVFQGFAFPWANLISKQSQGAGWVNPAVKPLPYDIAKANQILDGLGYMRGSNGIREVPATTGKYAQPAHQMSYDMMVPTSLDFSGQREFDIIANDWAKIGVKINFQNGGDSQQAYAIETAGNYTKFDMALWDWVGYIDPDFMLSVLTRPQWFSWSDTGYSNPAYDAEYIKQGTLTDFKQRQALVWKMEQQAYDQRQYIQLVNEELVTANAKSWTGFYPQLGAYCKCYYTSPHQS
ncbi:MAG TPA: ABC transporter substrate-binding protein [Gaiellales bacterium]|nr:ABC transporter substrate-binding protein [Gaiellales bacterium]